MEATQTCRGCGTQFPYDPDADYCPECAAENAGDNAPRCAVCGGPDTEGNGCEHCPAVAAVDTGALHAMTDNALRTVISAEREHGRAHGEVAEAARLLLALRTGDPS